MKIEDILQFARNCYAFANCEEEYKDALDNIIKMIESYEEEE